MQIVGGLKYLSYEESLRVGVTHPGDEKAPGKTSKQPFGT